MAENILIERNDRLAIITINRPDKLNALNIRTREELSDALDELRDDAAIRVVIITGAGEKAFIAGADISEFEGRTAIEQRAIMRARNIFTTAEEFPKPLIAMINGFCLGGGNELAMCCDLRIASEKARFGQPEINLGIIPGGGGTQRLTRLIGEGRSMQMILTGEMIDAAEAQRIGLVNQLLDDDALPGAAMALAQRIAAAPPLAMQLTKRCLDLGMDSDRAGALAIEQQAIAENLTGSDWQGAIADFGNKPGTTP